MTEKKVRVHVIFNTINPGPCYMILLVNQETACCFALEKALVKCRSLFTSVSGSFSWLQAQFRTAK